MSVEDGWKGPTIAEIAEVAGVGTATVDRVLNGRQRVREATRLRVIDALEQLKKPTSVRSPNAIQRRIACLCESGTSYNKSLEEAVANQAQKFGNLHCTFSSIVTSELDPVKFAQQIERTTASADGLIVVAREDLLINRVLRDVSRRKPVITLTTDLPNSGRTAYVGNDQVSAGATAAYFMGRLVGPKPAKILLVVSAPYRVQEDREIGFRRVLRADFPHLEVIDRANSNDDTEYSYRNIVRYIEQHGPVAGIYNTAAGNVGIAKALTEKELADQTVFIGHELNVNSRMLLENGVMDIVIAHDVADEVSIALEYMSHLLDGENAQPPSPTTVRVYTKYNCN